MPEKLHFRRSGSNRREYFASLGDKLFALIRQTRWGWRAQAWRPFECGIAILYEGLSLVEARGAVVDAWVAEIEGGK